MFYHFPFHLSIKTSFYCLSYYIAPIQKYLSIYGNNSAKDSWYF